MRPFVHHDRHRTRRGRVLVECCVSLVLLAGGSTLVLLMATSSAMLADEARQLDLVQRETARRLAPLEATPCAIGAGTSHFAAGARTTVTVRSYVAGPLRERRVETHWQTPALAGLRSRQHDTRSVARCE